MSDEAITHSIGLYQTMLAARQQDPERLAEAYRNIESLVLTIDGLQPEKGHETLYVGRELTRKRVWCAEPVLDADSRAQGKMRRTVRGLRAIERRVLEERRQAAAPAPTPPDESPKTKETPHANPSEATAAAPRASSDLGLTSTESTREATGVATPGEARGEDEVGEVVLGYCAAVRGMLHDSQGGPLHPPGVRMSEALQAVRDALERTLQAKKGGLPSHC